MSKLLVEIGACAMLVTSILVSTIVNADEGDSCQANSDCDADGGEHCIKNVCTIKKSKPGKQSSGAGGSGSCPGLQPGYTLTCQLITGQVVNACGYPGAVPAQVGTPCHIGATPGTSVAQQ